MRWRRGRIRTMIKDKLHEFEYKPIADLGPFQLHWIYDTKTYGFATIKGQRLKKAIESGEIVPVELYLGYESKLWKDDIFVAVPKKDSGLPAVYYNRHLLEEVIDATKGLFFQVEYYIIPETCVLAIVERGDKTKNDRIGVFVVAPLIRTKTVYENLESWLEVY